MSEQTREPIFGNSLNSVAKPADPEPPVHKRIHDGHYHLECLDCGREWKPGHEPLTCEAAPVPKEPAMLIYSRESSQPIHGLESRCPLCGGNCKFPAYCPKFIEVKPVPTAAPVDQQEGQRLRFEAWFRVEYPIRGMDWLPLSNHYASSFVESHWVTWRASLTSSPQPATNMISRTCGGCNQTYELPYYVSGPESAICPHCNPRRAASSPESSEPVPQQFSVGELCSETMCPVAGGGYLYCNEMKGHDGYHAHTFQQLLYNAATAGSQGENAELESLRATVKRCKESLRKIGNYTAAHDDVIDASWVAKVIDEARAEEQG